VRLRRVHQAALDADEAVLGGLSHLGQLHGLEVEPLQVVPDGAERDLKRGAAADSACHREVGMHERLEIGQLAKAHFGQGPGDRRRVLGPAAHLADLDLGGIERLAMPELLADQLAVARRPSGGDGDESVDRGRTDEALVVIGVLANQVDAAGG
jgi:hypothetical protein